MKNTQTKRDGFEGSARHRADDDRIGKIFTESIDVQSGGVVRAKLAQRQVHGHRADAMCGKRIGKLARVPIDAIDDETDDPAGMRDVRRRSVQPKDASSRPKSISPD